MDMIMDHLRESSNKQNRDKHSIELSLVLSTLSFISNKNIKLIDLVEDHLLELCNRQTQDKRSEESSVATPGFRLTPSQLSFMCENAL